jgi:uncharacterized protein (TIGR04255 family)
LESVQSGAFSLYLNDPRYRRDVTDAADAGAEHVEVLPTFDRPPVVEVVLGFEFQPVAEFGAVRLAQLAMLWQARYPVVQEQQPLPMSPPIGVPGQFPAMFVNIGAPAIRLWLLSEDGSLLLQLQRDRLILNWRHASSDPYPHYDTLRPQFVRALRELTAFVREHGLGSIVGSAVEVSYVNEVVTESGLPSLSGILTAVSGQDHHLGMPVASRIIQAYNARSTGSGPAVLTLTADTQGRGPNSTLITLTYRAAVSLDATEEDVMGTMDLGHRDVLIGFAESTTDAMHTAWGRTS